MDKTRPIWPCMLIYNKYMKSIMHKIKSFRSLSILFIVGLILSVLFSVNTRASIFYGNILDNNLIFYLLFLSVLIILKTVFHKKLRTVKVTLLLLPIAITVLGSILLFAKSYVSYFNWSFITVNAILAAIVLLFIAIRLSQNYIGKTICVVLAVSSLLLASMGELSLHMSPLLKHYTGDQVLKFYNVTFDDSRPTYALSANLLGKVISEGRIFGVGPDQYTSIWQKYRPVELANTNYYNVGQSTASSLYFKLLSELGLAAIILLLLAIRRIYDIWQHGRAQYGVEQKINQLHAIVVAASLLIAIFISNDMLFYLYLLLIIYWPYENVAEENKSYVQKSLLILSILILILVSCKALSYGFLRVGVEDYNKDKDVNRFLKRLTWANRLYPNNNVDGFLARIYLLLGAETYNALQDKSDKAGLQEVNSYIMKAISQADKAVEKNRNDPNVYDARAEIYEAGMAIDKSTYGQKAMADYNKAIALDPYNPDHMLGLSKLNYALGDKENTANLIDRMLSLKSNYIPAYMTLADILDKENAHEKRAYVLQEALKADRSNQNIAYMLAQEYYKLGLYEDYQLLMGDLIKLNPDLKILKDEVAKAMSLIPVQNVEDSSTTNSDKTNKKAK